MRHILLFAQGAAYYGCAIAVVESSTLHIRQALRRLQHNEDLGVSIDSSPQIKPLAILTAEFSLGEDVGIVAREVDMPLMPPTVLLDSGHAEYDLEALNLIINQLPRGRFGA